MLLILTILVLNIFQKKNKKFVDISLITANICRIQPYDSIMCQCFSIGFFDFMLKGKSLIDFTNLFLPNNLKK